MFSAFVATNASTTAESEVTTLGPPRGVLHASRCTRCDDRCRDPVQDPADAWRYDSSIRGVPQVPADSHRRAAVAGGFRTTRVVRLLDRPLEGDTFVVETGGFKEGSWLDNSGHPHTEALRTTERFRRVDFGHMEVDVTIDDAKAYSRPWKSDTMRFTLQPDTELLEHLCENNRDLPVLERYWRGQEQAGASTKGKQ